MPQSEISDDLKRQLAARYLRHAVGEAPTVPWYVAAQLCPALFDLKEDDTLPIDRVIKELEETLAHKSEVGTPLFLYLDGHTSGTTVECIELSSLLAFRSTAFARFFAPTMRRSVVHYSSSIAVHSLAEAYVTAAKSETLAAVIHAAAELDDALLEDWGWQIATLAQAIKAGLEQIVQRQIPRVLGIEAADPGILAFLEDKFDRAITALSEENISHVLDATTAQARIRELGPMVGHLPWRSNVGFGSVYDCFTPTPDEQSATWAEVEKWLSEDRPAWWLTAVNHAARDTTIRLAYSLAQARHPLGRHH